MKAPEKTTLVKTYRIEGYAEEIQLNEEDIRNGVKLDFDLPYPCYKSAVLKIEFGQAEISDDAPRDEAGHLMIPGHNCALGDCDYECHVVSCAIHQGYEAEPYLCDLKEE